MDSVNTGQLPEMDEETRAKLRELQVYVPFLKRLIERLKSQKDLMSLNTQHAQHEKMVSLYNLLTKGAKKLKVSTLVKCEAVLQKLHLKFDKIDLHTQMLLGDPIDLTGPESPPPNLEQNDTAHSQIPVEIPTERLASPILHHSKDKGLNVNSKVKGQPQPQLLKGGVLTIERRKGGHSNTTPQIINKEKPAYRSFTYGNQNLSQQNAWSKVPNSPSFAEVRQKLAKVISTSAKNNMTSGCTTTPPRLPHNQHDFSIPPTERQNWSHNWDNQNVSRPSTSHNVFSDARCSGPPTINQNDPRLRKSQLHSNNDTQHIANLPHLDMFSEKHGLRSMPDFSNQTFNRDRGHLNSSTQSVFVGTSPLLNQPCLQVSTSHLDGIKNNSQSIRKDPRLSHNSQHYGSYGRLHIDKPATPPSSNICREQQIFCATNKNGISSTLASLDLNLNGSEQFTKKHPTILDTNSFPQRQLVEEDWQTNRSQVRLSTAGTSAPWQTKLIKQSFMPVGPCINKDNQSTEAKIQPQRFNAMLNDKFERTKYYESRRPKHNEPKSFKKGNAVNHQALKKINVEKHGEKKCSKDVNNAIDKNTNRTVYVGNNSAKDREHGIKSQEMCMNVKRNVRKSSISPKSDNTKQSVNEAPQLDKLYRNSNIDINFPKPQALSFKIPKKVTIDDTKREKNLKPDTDNENIKTKSDVEKKSSNISKPIKYKLNNEQTIKDQTNEQSVNGSIINESISKSGIERIKTKDDSLSAKEISSSELNLEENYNIKKKEKLSNNKKEDTEKSLIAQNNINDESNIIADSTKTNQETGEKSIIVTEQTEPDEQCDRKRPGARIKKIEILVNKLHINSEDMKRNNIESGNRNNIFHDKVSEHEQMKKQSVTEKKELKEQKLKSNKLKENTSKLLTNDTFLPTNQSNQVDQIDNSKTVKGKSTDFKIAKDRKCDIASEPNRCLELNKVDANHINYESNIDTSSNGLKVKMKDNAIINSMNNSISINNNSYHNSKNLINGTEDCKRNIPARILRRRCTMVEYTSAPLVNRKEVLTNINKVYEDAHSAQDLSQEQKKDVRRSKHLAEMFEKTDDNCRISTQNILSGKRRTRTAVQLNEVEISKAVFKHRRSGKKIDSLMPLAKTVETTSIDTTLELYESPSNDICIQKVNNACDLMIVTTNRKSSKRSSKKNLECFLTNKVLCDKVVSDNPVSKNEKENASNIIQLSESSNTAPSGDKIGNKCDIEPPVIDALRNLLPPEKLRLVMLIIEGDSNNMSKNVEFVVTPSTSDKACNNSQDALPSLLTLAVTEISANTINNVPSNSGDSGEVKVKKVRKPKLSELDKLNADIKNTDIVLTAGGRRTCTLSAEELSKLNLEDRVVIQNELCSLNTPDKNMDSLVLRTGSKSSESFVFGASKLQVPYKNTARRGRRFGNRHSESRLPINFNSNSKISSKLINSSRRCVIKIKRLKIPALKRRHSLQMDSSQKKNLTTSSETTKRRKLDTDVDNEVNSSSSSITKNTNINWHSLSAFANFCIVCNKQFSHVRPHYVQMHEEYFAARVKPSIMQELKEDKMNRPIHMIQGKMNKYFHRCPFCFKTERITNYSWIEHFARHMGEYAAQCSKCRMPKFRLTELDRHLIQCGPGAKAICNNYMKGQDISNLKAYVCHLCNFMQLSPNNLERHYVRQHDYSTDKANKSGFTILLFSIENVPKVSIENADLLEKEFNERCKTEELKKKKMDFQPELFCEKNEDTLSQFNTVSVENEIVSGKEDELTPLGSIQKVLDLNVLPNPCINEETNKIICSYIETNECSSDEQYNEKVQNDILRLAEETAASETPKEENKNVGSEMTDMLLVKEMSVTNAESEKEANHFNKVNENGDAEHEDQWEDIRVMKRGRNKSRKNIFKKFQNVLNVIRPNKQRCTENSGTDMSINADNISETSSATTSSDDIRYMLLPSTTPFRPLITNLLDLMEDSVSDPSHLVPKMTPLELLSSDIRSQQCNSNIHKISHVGYAALNGEDHNFVFHCLISNCKFLFSNEAIGLEIHFQREHPGTVWNGQCHTCNNLLDTGVHNITDEIKHMMDVHITNKGVNNNTNALKIKVRRFTGDCLTDFVTDDSSTNSPTSTNAVPNILISEPNPLTTTLSSNIENTNIPLKTGEVGLSIASVSSGEHAASVIAEIEKRTSQLVNSNSTDECITQSLCIASVISLNTTEQNVSVSQESTMAANKLQLVPNLFNQPRNECKTPKPIVVAEQYVAQDSNADFIITQTVSGTNTPQFNISLAPTNISAENLKLYRKSQTATTTTPNIEHFTCMARNCRFKAGLSTIMRDHLLFHQRENFSTKRDYLECAHCSYIASDIDGYIRHGVESHASANNAKPKICTVLQGSRHKEDEETPIQQCLSIKVVQALVAHTGIADDKLYKCPVKGCHIVLTENSFNTHVLFHGASILSLKCPHCNVAMPKPHSLRGHIKKHAQHTFFCFYCLATGENSDAMHRHISENHFEGLKNVVNTILNLESRTQRVTSYYITAMESLQPSQVYDFGTRLLHQWEKIQSLSKVVFKPTEANLLPKESIFGQNLYCGDCRYYTKVRLNMVRHLQIHLNCGEGVDVSDGNESTQNLQQGIAISDPVNPMPCLASNERFFDKMTNLASSSLVTSVSTSLHTWTNANASTNDTPIIENDFHVSDVPRTAYVPEEKRFVCGISQCHYLGSSENLYQSHITSLHKNGERFVCSFCGVSMRLKVDRVMKHLRYHQNELFQCSECHLIHFRKFVIERHITERHPNSTSIAVVKYTRQYLGDLAGSVIRLPASSRKNHTSAATLQHSNSRWECTMCSCVLPSYNQVVAHCNLVHNIKQPFRCPNCVQTSQNRCDIEKHIKEKHSSSLCEPIVVFKKVTEPPQLNGTNTKPIWSRNDPRRQRNIRGILMNEELSSLGSNSPKQMHSVDSNEITNIHYLVQYDVAAESADNCASVDNGSLPPNMEYACIHCDHNTNNFVELRSHWLELHGRGENDALPFYFRLQPLLACAICSTFTGNSHLVHRHLLEKHKLRNLVVADIEKLKASSANNFKAQFECGYCNFNYSTVQELAQHKSHMCHNPHDLKRFSEAQLQVLMKLGQTEKYYQCSLCPVILPYELSMVHHRNEKHSQDNFSFRPLQGIVYHCGQCKFASNEELVTLRHMLEHYDRFKCCEYCLQSLDNFNAYAQHLYEKHRREVSNFSNLHTFDDLFMFFNNILYQFPNGFVINKKSLSQTKYGNNAVVWKLYAELKETVERPPIPRLSMAELLTRKCIAKSQQSAQQLLTVPSAPFQDLTQPKLDRIVKRRFTVAFDSPYAKDTSLKKKPKSSAEY